MHIAFSLDTALNSSYIAVGANFRPEIAALFCLCRKTHEEKSRQRRSIEA
jgi:hypothetical protein